MVKEEVFGFDWTELVPARGDEMAYANLIAPSENDMLSLLKSSIFAKTTMKERGLILDINDKKMFIVKIPRFSITVACYVKTESFFNETHNYVVFIGSLRSTGVKLRS